MVGTPVLIGISVLLAFLIVLFTLFMKHFIHHSQFKKMYLSDIGENAILLVKKYLWRFKRNRNKAANINVSRELSRGNIPLFIQWDKRWGYLRYGNNHIGINGCAPTALSMVICGLKKDPSATPDVVGHYSEKQGYYVPGSGTAWELMTDGAAHFGLQSTAGEISSDYILNNLSSRSPMICSMTPGDFTSNGHYIVLVGIDERGKVIVNDPNSPSKSKKRWNVDSLVSQMKAIWCFHLDEG